MRKNNLLAAFFILLGISAANSASAVCPICTVVVSSGIGLSRYLGIDDSITGLWIGGLTVSMIIWTMDWMKKKNKSFRGDKFTIIFAYYALILLPLYYTRLDIDNLAAALCSCASDRLFVSIVIGSLGFWAGAEWYYLLKEKNGGHAYFPFQKVVMPVLPLAFASAIFYMLTK